MKRLKRTLLGILFLILTMTVGINVQAAGTKKEVIFHDNNGKIIKTVKAVEGKVRLFSVENPKGYTFLGWSSSSGQSKAPEYLAGEVIRVTGRKHLYAVMFQRKKEKDIPPSELPVLNTSKYSEVIFVGDSRIVGMRRVLEKQCSKKQLKNVSFVCLSGQGLSWFRSRGITLLNKIISNERKTSQGNKKIAVIFNLGVNDIRHWEGKEIDCSQVIYNYLTYMNKLSFELENKGCKLFYMSVNPINGSMSKVKNLRREWELLALNKSLKDGLNNKWRYIDVFDKLIQNGHSTVKTNAKTDDGIHYTDQTYKRIYKFCIEKINRS